MPESSQQKKITMSFKKSPEYKMYPAGGAWVAPTIDGNKLVVNFIIDHPSLPSYQTFPISEEGVIDLKNVIDSTSAGELEREILCGILLTPEDAISIGRFLTENGERILGMKK
jgi:hypothetical protein